MTDSEKYILESIRIHVWSGFDSIEDVHELVDDLLEEVASADMLHRAVLSEFRRKAAAELSWPGVTDCDRLDRAFADLNSLGIVALQNAGFTMSEGIGEVAEVLHERGPGNAIGYCFYHGQDVERAVNGGGLDVAFGDLKDDREETKRIGAMVLGALERQGLKVIWNGDAGTRILIKELDWRRRGHYGAFIE